MAQQLTCIRRSPTRQALNEPALVLSAVAIAHQIDFDGHDWCLWVDSDDVPAANLELERYDRENRPAQRVPRTAVIVDSGWIGVLGYLLVIWALPSLEGAQTFGWRWRDAGVMDAALVQAGQWWRTVTALTLHGDLAHLIGNALFGAVFGLYVGRYLGSGVGWLLVLLAGAAGNGLNALLQPDGFRSVGASTATFAALSVVGAFVWRRGYLRAWGWRRRFAPVFGGIALLAFTGFGGENTDVMAHVLGFACGLLLGVIAGSFEPIRSRALQRGAGALTLGLIAYAWLYAGSAVG